MPQPSKTVIELIQELSDNFTQLAEDAEKRRKSASDKSDYYRFEFADGEKQAYQDSAKKLTVILNKCLQAT